jgi:CRISPR-associated endonuclease/helicase Cas3
LEFERLLAKSARGTARAQTIRRHTAEVLRTAEALIKATGADQLKAHGLDPGVWLEPFRRTVLIAALLHDLGKANDHFQGMICGTRGRDRPQGLRHEVVSFLIAGSPEIQAWIKPALEGACKPDLILWAVAGHHRKFPPDGALPGSGSTMRVYQEHDDFHETLELGRGGYGLELGPPPRFEPRHELERLPLTMKGAFRTLERVGQDAETTMQSLSGEEQRALAAIKACLICADVAGSIGRRGSETMADWIPKAFARVPSPEQIERIVAGRLKGLEPRPFQETIADAPGDLALVVAGCGTGKTIAAYARAAHRHPGRRVYFCYPTTGTATEGYRDYLADPALGADLSHGRAEVDKAILDLHQGAVPNDLLSPEIHDDDERNDRITADSAGAMEQWSTPLVSCTVDTVLGLLQNNRRGVYAWPSIAGSFCVFDEVHAYDEKLFGALVRFLRDLPGVPCLLMTASLPDDRLRRLREAMKERGESTVPIPGPEDLETVPRYRRAPGSSIEDAWRRVRETRDQGGKVLWVVNIVDAAIELGEAAEAMDLSPRIYHSRFRYVDRVERHRDVINAFDSDGFALAITTQVAEMSLDLSADLLVTHLAPIPALIQRLGRLNRRAAVDGSSGLRPFLILEPPFSMPYDDAELEAARRWLAVLGDGPIHQRDLVERWREIEPGVVAEFEEEHVHAWIDGGFITMPRSLREPGYGIDVILECDADDVWAGRRKPEEVRIPMPQPKGSQWKQWRECAFCPVAPADAVIYDSKKGARWKN